MKKFKKKRLKKARQVRGYGKKRKGLKKKKVVGIRRWNVQGLLRYNEIRKQISLYYRERGIKKLRFEVYDLYRAIKDSVDIKAVPIKNLEDVVWSFLSDLEYVREDKKENHDEGFNWFDIGRTLMGEYLGGKFKNGDVVVLDLSELGYDDRVWEERDFSGIYTDFYRPFYKMLQEVDFGQFKAMKKSPIPEVELVSVARISNINFKYVYKLRTDWRRKPKEAVKIPEAEVIKLPEKELPAKEVELTPREKYEIEQKYKAKTESLLQAFREGLITKQEYFDMLQKI